jgi:hypothetical protein
MNSLTLGGYAVIKARHSDSFGYVSLHIENDLSVVRLAEAPRCETSTSGWDAAER